MQKWQVIIPALLARCSKVGAVEPKTRSGRPCQVPAVNGKQRCRMHGGAKGSGTPKGNQNALKHGRYRRQAIAEQKALRDLIRGFEATVDKVEKS